MTNMQTRMTSKPRAATTARRKELLDLIVNYTPLTVRTAFYLAATHLSHITNNRGNPAYAKNDAGYAAVGDDLAWMRDNGWLDYDDVLDGSGRSFDPRPVVDMQQALDIASDLIESDPWAGASYRVAFSFETAAMWHTYSQRLADLRPSGIGLGGNGRLGPVKNLADWLGQARECGTVLHVGDFDGQGVDIARDLQDRLELHAARGGYPAPEVIRVALTDDIIQRYSVPSHPPALAKTGKEKALDIKYGFTTETWEAEALPPDDMEAVLRAAFAGRVPGDWDDRLRAAEAAEGRQRQAIKDMRSAA